jgi:hypothetical protein
VPELEQVLGGLRGSRPVGHADPRDARRQPVRPRLVDHDQGYAACDRRQQHRIVVGQ